MTMIYLAQTTYKMPTRLEKSQFCWHFNHDVLFQRQCDEISIEARAQEIIRHKTPDQIDLRLALMRPIVGSIPSDILAAFDVMDNAYTKEMTCKADGDARLRALYSLWRTVARSTELIELHNRECYPWCPWNGATITPYWDGKSANLHKMPEVVAGLAALRDDHGR